MIDTVIDLSLSIADKETFILTCWDIDDTTNTPISHDFKHEPIHFKRTKATKEVPHIYYNDDVANLADIQPHEYGILKIKYGWDKEDLNIHVRLISGPVFRSGRWLATDAWDLLAPKTNQATYTMPEVLVEPSPDYDDSMLLHSLVYGHGKLDTPNE